jgi:Mrp family chromosome partitioning ATPase
LGELISEASEIFDIVLVDSPPVLDFADAPVIASHCEATLLVLASGSVRRPLAERAIDRLLGVRCNLVGALLTKFDAVNAGYGYGYGYYGRGYGYGRADDRRFVSDEVDDRRRIPLFLRDNRPVEDGQDWGRED